MSNVRDGRVGCPHNAYGVCQTCQAETTRQPDPNDSYWPGGGNPSASELTALRTQLADLQARFDALAKDAEAMRRERDKARDLALESAAQVVFGLMETGLDEQGRFYARSLSDEIRALKSGGDSPSPKSICRPDISKESDFFDASRDPALTLAADALEWYANPLTWPDENAVEYACAAISDSGSRAREALKAINSARVATHVKTDTFPNS